LGDIIVDNLSGLEFYDEKDVEGKETEGSYGTEIAGEEGLPVGGEEPFPGEVGLEFPCFSKAVDDTADGFVGEGNGKFQKFIPDTACTPEIVLCFEFEDKVFDGAGDGRPARGMF
jgi:hypothetical protein